MTSDWNRERNSHPGLFLTSAQLAKAWCEVGMNVRFPNFGKLLKRSNRASSDLIWDRCHCDWVYCPPIVGHTFALLKWTVSVFGCSLHFYTVCHIHPFPHIHTLMIGVTTKGANLFTRRKLGIKPPVFKLVHDPLYLLSHSHQSRLRCNLMENHQKYNYKSGLLCHDILVSLGCPLVSYQVVIVWGCWERRQHEAEVEGRLRTVLFSSKTRLIVRTASLCHNETERM